LSRVKYRIHSDKITIAPGYIPVRVITDPVLWAARPTIFYSPLLPNALGFIAQGDHLHQFISQYFKIAFLMDSIK
jgi:hypothetical protein